MLKGWQKVSGNWYYLRTATNTPSSGPEGSMVAGWLLSGGHWYYLADSGVGVSSASGDYGKMLKGLYKIGLYEYYFYNPGVDWMESEFSFPEGAMCKNINYTEIFGRDGVLVYATIDGEGHVHRHTLGSIKSTQGSLAAQHVMAGEVG